jgi:hypothetical protein
MKAYDVSPSTKVGSTPSTLVKNKPPIRDEAWLFKGMFAHCFFDRSTTAKTEDARGA